MNGVGRSELSRGEAESCSNERAKTSGTVDVDGGLQRRERSAEMLKKVIKVGRVHLRGRISSFEPTEKSRSVGDSREDASQERDETEDVVG